MTHYDDIKLMDSRLALTEEQKQVVGNFVKAYRELARNDIGLTEVKGCGVYAYNSKDVSCFNAPYNAAYDNGKELINIFNLFEIEDLRYGFDGILCHYTDVFVAFI